MSPVSRPDDLWPMQDVIRMAYDVAFCNQDEIANVIHKSSGWLSYSQYLIRMTYGQCIMSSRWGWYLIRMSYGNVIMSSGWHTLPFLSHPDEIANFDFPQHVVVLQRFRSHPVCKWCKHDDSKITGWTALNFDTLIGSCSAPSLLNFQYHGSNAKVYSVR